MKNERHDWEFQREFFPDRELKAHPKPEYVMTGSITERVHLGKKEKKYDKRTLQLTDYVTPKTLLPQRPVRAFYGYKVTDWPMYNNSKLGDCTCAAVGHMEQCWSSFTQATPERPPDQAVLDLYWATGSQDDGRYCLDVLNYWRNNGFTQQAGGKEKIVAYAEVNPLDTEMVKTAIWLFGGLYIGIGLPITAQSQWDRWTYISGAPADEREFGSWGGHAVNIVAFSDYNLWLITWGYKMKMSWAFWKHYVDECYAIISPDWFNKL